MSGHFPNSHAVFLLPCFHFWQSLFLECSISFWIEKRKWHPQHFQKSLYFQGIPPQIHTDNQSWLQQWHCMTWVLSLKKLYHTFPFQNVIFVLYHFVTEFWMFQSQEAGWNSISPSPVHTWNSRPLPHPPTQWSSPLSGPTSQFFPPISMKFPWQTNALFTMESHQGMLTPNALQPSLGDTVRIDSNASIFPTHHWSFLPLMKPPLSWRLMPFSSATFYLSLTSSPIHLQWLSNDVPWGWRHLLYSLQSVPSSGMTWGHPTPDLIIPKPLDSITLTCSAHQQPFQWFTQDLISVSWIIKTDALFSEHHHLSYQG